MSTLLAYLDTGDTNTSGALAVIAAVVVICAGLVWRARTIARHQPPKVTTSAPREPQPLTAGKVFMVGVALIFVWLFVKGFTNSP